MNYMISYFLADGLSVYPNIFAISVNKMISAIVIQLLLHSMDPETSSG